jgi:hypothetical protein
MGRLPSAHIFTTLIVALVAAAGPARALETDQFTVPKRPLPDVGAELDVYVAATVWDVVQNLNTRAAAHEREARKAPWPWKDYHRGRAERYRSEELLAQRVYDALAGPGLPESRIELWVRRHRFRAAEAAGEDAEFPVTLARCVYGDSLFSKPPLLAFLSPTIHAHGSYFGVDKLGHVFQHGFFYYREYRAARAEGCGDAEATARAVAVGVGEEEGFYGAITTGVYSNADLAGNYAGLKFYLNLTRRVRIGEVELEPLLLRGRAGDWHLNPCRRPEGLLEPFIDDHLNEALNPSRYNGVLRDTVRSRLRSRAAGVLAFYDSTPDQERRRATELSTWHGDRYGHSGMEGLVMVPDAMPRRRESAPVAVDVAAREAAAHLPAGGPPHLSTR